MDDLVKKTGVEENACKHLEATGSEIAQNTGKRMSKNAASMARLRAMKKQEGQQTSPIFWRSGTTISLQTKAMMSSSSGTRGLLPT